MSGVASKEEKEEKPAEAQQIGGMTMYDVIVSTVKKVSLVGFVYLAGYMNWSVAWLIGPIVMLVLRDHWRKDNKIKRDIAKSVALSNEKDVVLARINDLPAWVFFPDIERTEWLNRIIKQCWPNVNSYAKDLMVKAIEPSLRSSLEKYKLNGFKFERIILGEIRRVGRLTMEYKWASRFSSICCRHLIGDNPKQPFRIGGVKVYEKNISRNEIIMDLDVYYAGNCDISFVLSGMKGGIRDFQLHGMLRVVMKPLITSIPLIGGLQVFFLNNPSIDFDLVGIVDIFDMPGLSDILRRIVVEQVASMMVLPNKFPIKLSDLVESIDLKRPEPEGVLRIHVIEAKNLMKKDISMLGKGKSDPYAVLTVGAQEFRTKTILNTVDPKWDYWCEFIVTEANGQQLYVRLMDEDDAKEDEFLGRATIEVANIARKGQEDLWITLEQATKGIVHLRLTWMTLSAEYSDLQAALAETQMLRVTDMHTTVLCLYIDSAKMLPQTRASTKPDPYLTITCGKYTQQTGVIMRTTDPVWEQGFTFLVANPESDSLYFKVLDQKTGSDMGELVYQLTTLSRKVNLAVPQQPFGLKKGGPESKLVMSLHMRILKKGKDEAEVSAASSAKEDLSRRDSSTSAASTENQRQPPEFSAYRQLSTQESLDSSVFSEGNEDAQGMYKEATSAKGGIANISPTQPSPAKKAVSRESSISSVGGVSQTGALGSDGTGVVEDIIEEENVPLVSSPSEATLLHRTPSATSSSGEHGLGRIQLTLRYSVQRQRLIVVIHKIANIPLKDPSSIPDPYVKLYLLPERSKESKRKTNVIKDNCNPTYDETFEYVISQGELSTQQLEITVCTQKQLFYSSSNVLGQVIIDLSENNLTQAYNAWFDMQPEAD